MSNPLLSLLDIDYPLIQAPMAGVSTPALAAAVSDGRTVLTSAISGRPARCLANAFCALGEGYPASAVPDYPLAYDIGKALAAAAKAQGVHEYGAHWAGQGVGLIRECDAATLVRQLAAESGWN